MRSPSVKVIVSTAIVIVVLSAAPAEAARRSSTERRQQQPQRVAQLIREALARTFGVIAQALPTIPIPGTTKDDETSEKSAPLLPVSEETEGSGS